MISAGLHRPEGAPDNSPAFQRWLHAPKCNASPAGTAETPAPAHHFQYAEGVPNISPGLPRTFSGLPSVLGPQIPRTLKGCNTAPAL